MSQPPTSPSLPPFGEDHGEPDLQASIELVRRAQGGDSGALGELFERYLPRLLRIVRARMGRKLARKMDAEDLVQEAYLAATANIETFELRSHAGILGWLSKIAENRIRDAAGRFGTEKRDVDRETSMDKSRKDGQSVWAEDPVDLGPRPSQILERRELEETVDQCVHELSPPAYRQVILLRDYLDSSWEEIRVELDRPTVRACEELHRRAHIRLRRALRPYLRDGQEAD